MVGKKRKGSAPATALARGTVERVQGERPRPGFSSDIGPRLAIFSHWLPLCKTSHPSLPALRMDAPSGGGAMIDAQLAQLDQVQVQLTQAQAQHTAKLAKLTQTVEQHTATLAQLTQTVAGMAATLAQIQQALLR